MLISYAVLREDGEQEAKGADGDGPGPSSPSYSRGTVLLVLTAGRAAAFVSGAGFGERVFPGIRASTSGTSTGGGLQTGGGVPDKQTASSSSSDSDADENNNPCSMDYWKRRIAEEGTDADDLKDLAAQDMGFVYQSFSIHGRTDAAAKSDVDEALMKKSLDREIELKNSVACLNKTLPGISHSHNSLGDFPSYTEGVAAMHAWAKRRGSPYAGTFVTDTDVYANPFSKLNPKLLTWALQNVDLALVYNPNRAKGYERENFRHPNFLRGLQSNGLQGGFMGYRNSTRAMLFHGCVEHTMRESLEEGHEVLKQQRAINMVLQSEVGQLVRTRWLPAEFQCWMGGKITKDTKLSDWVIPSSSSVVTRDTNCFFIHSHYVGGLEACFE